MEASPAHMKEPPALPEDTPAQMKAAPAGLEELPALRLRIAFFEVVRAGLEEPPAVQWRGFRRPSAAA